MHNNNIFRYVKSSCTEIHFLAWGEGRGTCLLCHPHGSVPLCPHGYAPGLSLKSSWSQSVFSNELSAVMIKETAPWVTPTEHLVTSYSPWMSAWLLVAAFNCTSRQSVISRLTVILCRRPDDDTFSQTYDTWRVYSDSHSIHHLSLKLALVSTLLGVFTRPYTPTCSLVI